MIKTSKKIVKYFSIFTIITSLLLIASAALFIHLYPEEKLLEIIKENSTKILKRKVEISSINYSFKGIVVNDLKLYEKDQSNIPIFSTEEAVIRFSPLALINKEIKIWSITINRGKLAWNFFKKGSGNIQKLIEDLQEDKEKQTGSSFKINLSKINLKDFELNISNIPDRLAPINGIYKINTTIIIDKNKDLFIADSSIKLPKNRGILQPELKINLHDKFSVDGKIQLIKSQLDWVYNFRSSHGKLPFKTVTATINKFKADKNTISGFVKGWSSLHNSNKIIKISGDCSVAIWKRIVDISSASGNIDKTTFNLNRLIINANYGNITNISLKKSNIYLQDLRSIVQSLPVQLRGNLVGDVSLGKKLVNADLKLKNIKYTMNKIKLFSIPLTSIKIKNNTIKKQNIPIILLDDNKASLSIATIDRNLKKIYAVVKSKHLVLDKIQELSPEKSGIKNGKIDIPASISGKILLNETFFKNYKAMNSKIDYNVGGKFINIKNIRSSIFGGNVSGSGKILITAERPIVNTLLKFSNIKVNQITFSDDNMNNRFYGFAGGRAKLRFTLGDKITDTTTGNIILNISKGKVVNTGIQKGLILFLADLKYKLRDLEFKRIYGNIDILGNQYKANSVIFNAEDMRLSLKGKMDRNLSARNMEMKLEFTNHFIKDIPRPAVTLLKKYSSGSWYTIPFLINGNITDSKNIKLK